MVEIDNLPKLLRFIVDNGFEHHVAMVRGHVAHILEEAGKKYLKTVTDKSGKKRTVYYGAKGYKIAPGTKRGDSYCARSYGQMKKHPAAAIDPNSPLRLSRKKWKCSGKKSRRT